MAFTSSYTPGLIQQSEYYYGTPEMTPGLSGSFSGSFQGDGSALTNTPSIYTSDGNILSTRTINDRAGGFTGTAGSNALKMNVRNSGALLVAGYQNNGNPGTTNHLIQWGPGATNGGMNVRGKLGLTGGGGRIDLTNSGGSQYFTVAQTGITSTVSLSATTITNNSAVADTKLTGSFTGSFVGDGSELTGISAFPFTGDAQITGSLLISGSKIHLRGESASPGPILELESINGGSGKDVYIKVGDSNENYAYVFGADDTGNTFRISSGNYSSATLGTNDKFIIDGDNIEFPAGNISGSITSTASFGHYLGDGSQLTNLPASPTPTLQQVTDQGASTTNNISLPNSAQSIDFVSNAGIYGRTGGSYPGLHIASGTGTGARIWLGNQFNATGAITASFLGLGAIMGVHTIEPHTNRPLILRGGKGPNDANDGIQMFTGDASNVYQKRFEIESDGTNVDAYFTNIDGFGINDTTPTAMLDVNGNINTTSDITASGHVSGSATSTASFGHYIGDGSGLTNLPAATAGSTSGRVVFTTTNGELTSEAGFTYDATTDRLTVPNLTTTTFTASFITSSTIETSGSNIFGDEAGVDVQTLIGTTKMTGSAQITGSLSLTGVTNALNFTNTNSTASVNTKLSFRHAAGNDYNSLVYFGSNYFRLNNSEYPNAAALYVNGRIQGSNFYAPMNSNGFNISSYNSRFTNNYLALYGSSGVTFGASNAGFATIRDGAAGTPSSTYDIDALLGIVSAGNSTGFGFKVHNSDDHETFAVQDNKKVIVSGSLEVSGSIRVKGQVTGSTSILGDTQITGSLKILPATNINAPVKIYGSGASTIVGFGDNSTRFIFGSSGTATMVGFKMYSGILAGALDGGSQVINKLDRLELGGYGFGGTSVIGMVSPAGTVTVPGNGFAMYPDDANGAGTVSPHFKTEDGSILTIATTSSLKRVTADSSQISGSGGLTVESSGSTVFEVIGSQGTLFSINDDLDGTLLNVKDRSGIPVLQASASGEIYLGQSPQSLYTTAVISSTNADVTQSLYGLDTSSYGGAFFDYIAHSGSNARGGTVSSVWTPGGSVVFSETTTTHIGDTSNLNLVVHFSQSQAQLACYADTSQYNIKIITRAI